MLPTVEVIEFVCRHAAARMASSSYYLMLKPTILDLKRGTCHEVKQELLMPAVNYRETA
jgi:hypothetical protein